MLRTKLIKVIEADFVVYEGSDPPDDLSTGQYVSYPQLLDRWCALTAAHLRPKNCVRFHFLTFHLRMSEVDSLKKTQHLNRPYSRSEVIKRSGYFFVDCIPLTPEQAIWNRFRTPGLQVPCTRSISCLSDQVDVLAGRKEAILGNNGHIYVMDPAVDRIWSTRPPRPNEFRCVA